MDIEKIAKAIEDDAAMELPGLRESLAEMQAGIQGRVYSPEQLLARSARSQLGLSQQAFADLIKTPVATLRDWEQGRFPPPGAVLCLLQIIIKHPDVLLELTA